MSADLQKSNISSNFVGFQCHGWLHGLSRDSMVNRRRCIDGISRRSQRALALVLEHAVFTFSPGMLLWGSSFCRDCFLLGP